MEIHSGVSPRLKDILADNPIRSLILHTIGKSAATTLSLQIHRETRQLAHKTYQCFTFGANPTRSTRIWIDFARDVVFPNDDYRTPDGWFQPDCDKMTFVAPDLVQNLAISADRFRYPERGEGSQVLQKVVEGLLGHFTALKKLYIVYEDGIDPYATGRIRFFPMERTCLPTCDNKGCINLASIAADSQRTIDELRAFEPLAARGVNIRFVGAWRGGSRAECGHAIDGYESESDDEYHDPEDDPENGYESSGVTVTPDERRGRVIFGTLNYLVYDEADHDVTFSDHKGKIPLFVPVSLLLLSFNTHTD